MTRKRIISKLPALAASAITVIALSACGNATTGTSKTAMTEDPSGTPVTYTGTLPMPKASGDYSNPKSRDQLKDKGTVTYSISEIGPNWNAFSVNGNTVYMSTLWNYYMPSLWMSSLDGSTIKPNPNYLTSYKISTVKGKQTIVLNFNPKAKWNDGRAIDWTAVKAAWTVTSGKNTNYTAASTTGWEQVSTVTKGTTAKQAIITMKTPYYPATSFISIYPPQAVDVKTYTSGWTDNPHDKEWGAGPYVIKTRTDSQVTFTPNPKWWGNKPKMTTVTYKALEDQAALNAFKNKEINAVSLSTADDIKNIRSVTGATIRRGYTSDVSIFEFNAKKSFLKDINVRKAIVQGINREQMSKLAFAGLDWSAPVPGSELVYPTQKGYKDNMPKEAAFNTANAKKTLEADGYKLGSDGYYAKNGTTLTLSYTTFGDSSKVKARGLAVQKMMKNIGIKLTIDNRPSSDFSKTLSDGDWQILGMAWSFSGTPDSYNYGKQLYGMKSESNYSGIGSKKIDAMFAKVNTLNTVSAQIAQTNKAESAAFKLYGQLPYANSPIMGAYSKGLANVGPAGYKTILVEDVGWEK